MVSYLAYANLSEVTMASGKDVKADDHEWSTEEADKETTAQGKRLQILNRKAAGIVMNSINVTTKEGKAAFAIVDPFHDADTGFAGGHFYNEWAALKDWYDNVVQEDLEQIRNRYYQSTMAKDVQPSMFILDMKKTRKDLEMQGYKISHKEFLKRILHCLPKNSEGVGPYSHKKEKYEELIKKAEKAKKPEDELEKITLSDMTADLEEVWKELDADARSSSAEGEKGFFASGKGG